VSISSYTIKAVPRNPHPTKASKIHATAHDRAGRGRGRATARWPAGIAVAIVARASGRGP
jgi:hypothetical protein